MRSVDYRDLIGGTLIILAGAVGMYHSLTAFQVGTAARMGPGYFPAITGGLLILCGILIVIPALRRAGPMPTLELRPLIWISLSVLAFALLVLPFGLVPAVIVQSLVASQADSKLSRKGSLLLAVCLAGGAWVIFKGGLGVILPAFAWPW
ncbi:tripartite tricarboxylate transporter TctB family protein [Bordetella sp. 02P26C-1]|uniref:tripartite tricarboxylate transporter TctB family protein n=1 Tax=Bordetella sp. 02P26C-1 TaxID=2683195 RepID=UPI001355B0CD|nr:tripartite tricarboxylate transporter TctB family protein [Bordetella sp. 02P26C-1]MVW79279.1 tripartite tricarboxylate transporter TctB family protein [Bordetella sp. 02P26C-1]